MPEKLERRTPSEIMHAYLMRRVEQAVERRSAAYEKLQTPEETTACAHSSWTNSAGFPSGRR